MKDRLLEDWKEMMCKRMHKSMHHCVTPFGIMTKRDACKGRCRYSHYPLCTDLSKEKFDEWKLNWYDSVPKCRDFVCCHELMSCGIGILCGDCTLYNTWKKNIYSAYKCTTVYCADCRNKYTCQKMPKR